MNTHSIIAVGEGQDPMAALRRAHHDQLALCDSLEEIADSLPDQVNRQKCIYAAKALGPLIRGIHRFEEDVVFPIFAERFRDEPTTMQTIERLKFEHCEDECFSEELVEALHDLGSGKPDINMEATGYMLRGFFEAMRRHIAHEGELLSRCES